MGNTKIKISRHQLFTLMFIFEIGSTTLFALGIKAKQDAWIVILFSLIIGLGLIWIYTELQKNFPEKNYAEIIISILGKPLGTPLALLYALYWLWPAARNLREFGELINISLLQSTPLFIILLTFVLTSLYFLVLGVEVLGRTSEVTLPIVVVFLLSVFVMIYISGQVDFYNLKPILADGIIPVIKAAFPNVAMFPFGEIFIFSMYWHYVNQNQLVRRTTILVAIFSGLLLSLTLLFHISVLGVEYTSISIIPLLEVIKLINIGDIITNIDALGVIIMFLGGFYKMSLFFYGVTLIIATIFNIKNFKLLLSITGIILLWVSIIFEPSYIYHRWMTPFDTNYFYIVFLNIIPTLLLLIHWVKKNI